MKIAVVTGASSGMGREFVRQLGYFYRSLDEIWVIARRRERLEELRELSRIPIRIFEGNLIKKQVYRELSCALEEEQPDIRMLVNAAGFGKSGGGDCFSGLPCADGHGGSELPCSDQDDAVLSALSGTGKPYHQSGVCGGVLSAAGLCSVRRHKILCAQLFEGSGSRAAAERRLCDSGLSGTGRYRILQYQRCAHESAEKADNGESGGRGAQSAEGQPRGPGDVCLWNCHARGLSRDQAGATWTDHETDEAVT